MYNLLVYHGKHVWYTHLSCLQIQCCTAKILHAFWCESMKIGMMVENFMLKLLKMGNILDFKVTNIFTYLVWLNQSFLWHFVTSWGKWVDFDFNVTPLVGFSTYDQLLQSLMVARSNMAVILYVLSKWGLTINERMMGNFL